MNFIWTRLETPSPSHSQEGASEGSEYGAEYFKSWARKKQSEASACQSSEFHMFNLHVLVHVCTIINEHCFITNVFKNDYFF